MDVNKDKLKRKGWSDYEINHVLDIFDAAEANKHPWIKWLDEGIYWVLLAVVLAGNVAFTVALLPAMIALPNSLLYIVVALSGLVFGALSDSLLAMIDKIDRKHHVIYVILIPLVAIVSYAFILAQANQTVAQLGSGYTHNLLLGLIYIASFMLPYAVIKRKKNGLGRVDD